MMQANGAAYVNAQVACALIEMESMKVANQERMAQGHAFAYGEDAFLALIEKYGIHHNATVQYL
jgi:hypothetical protein